MLLKFKFSSLSTKPCRNFIAHKLLLAQNRGAESHTSLFLSLSLSFSIYLSLSLSLSFYLFIYLSIYLALHLPTYLPPRRTFPLPILFIIFPICPRMEERERRKKGGGRGEEAGVRGVGEGKVGHKGGAGSLV